MTRVFSVALCTLAAWGAPALLNADQVQDSLPRAYARRPVISNPVPLPDEVMQPPVVPMQVDTPLARAFEYSDAYGTRVTIHRIGSYAMLPLFAGEYLLGQRLLDSGGDLPSWVRPTHVAVASGLGVLFVTNTVTGVWNALEARKDPGGRTRRLVHAALMLASDAGFAYTGTLADGATRTDSGASRHRAAALASISLSTAGTLLMWLWKDKDDE